MATVITTPIIHLMLRLGLWFVLIMVVYFFVYLRKQLEHVRAGRYVLSKFFSLIFLLLLALAAIIVNTGVHPWLVFLDLAVLFGIIQTLFAFKSPFKRVDRVATTAMMTLILLYSMI